MKSVYSPPQFLDWYFCTQVSWTYDEIAIGGQPVITPGGGSWAGWLDDPDGDPFCDLAHTLD